MVAATDLAGFWAGTIVHGSESTRVFLNLSVYEEGITGSYEVPTSPSVYRTGRFAGTLTDDSLILTLAENDPHGPLEFTLRVLEGDEYMLLGYTFLAKGCPKFASATFYRSGPPLDRSNGIWP